MEQQLDAFTQKRFELMVEMATKKLQQEIDSLKLAFNSLKLFILIPNIILNLKIKFKNLKACCQSSL